MLLLLDVARANSKVNPFLHGSARWADRRDIKAAGLLQRQSTLSRGISFSEAAKKDPRGAYLVRRH